MVEHTKEVRNSYTQTRHGKFIGGFMEWKYQLLKVKGSHTRKNTTKWAEVGVEAPRKAPWLVFLKKKIRKNCLKPEIHVCVYGGV